MENLLIASDFSEHSAKALELGVQIAEKFNAHIWLLHICEPEPDFVGYKAGPNVVREQVAKEFHNEHKELQSLADKYRSKAVQITPLVIQGSTVEKILEQAQKLDADLILVGASGKGKIESVLIGSVSKKILQQANIPVLLCK